MFGHYPVGGGGDPEAAPAPAGADAAHRFGIPDANLRCRPGAPTRHRYEDLQPEDVIDLLSRNLRPSGLPPGFGGAIALTDRTIHHQDIRRALGIPRSIPPDRLAAVLDFALGAPTLPAKKNAKGSG